MLLAVGWVGLVSTFVLLGLSAVEQALNPWHLGALGLLAAVGAVRLGLIYGAQAKYKPVLPTTTEDWPTVTVVIPAYNEGQGVYETLASTVQNGYPRHKLRVILVDDGSTDDTLAWMRCGQVRWPDHVTVLVNRRNLGKRAALAKAFERVDSQLIVTVDADSYLTPGALRHMVAPLRIDPSIGGVAGHVTVANRDDHALTQTIALVFEMAFGWERAAQSVTKTVLCLPGAGSALRASAVQAVLWSWRRERFLGRRSRIGEDRSLTSRLLGDGWRTVYQSTAIIETRIPPHLPGVWRTYLRWARGDWRESFKLVGLLYGASRGRRGRLAWAVIYAWTDLVLPLLAMAACGSVLWTAPVLMPWVAWGFVLGSSCPMLLYLAQHRRKRPWSALLGSVPWGIFHTLTVTLWALLTIRNDRWLTRPSGQAAQPPSDRVEVNPST